MTEVEQPQTNGIDTAEDENNISRPADIEAVCVIQLFIINYEILIFLFEHPNRTCAKWNDVNVWKKCYNHVYSGKN